MLACRPMLSLAVALVAGVLLERHFPSFDWFWPYGSAFLALFIFLFIFSPPLPPEPVPGNLPPAYQPHILPVPGFFARRGLNRFMLLLCLAVFFAGMARQHAWRNALNPDRLPDKRWFNARLIAGLPSHSYEGEPGIISIPALLVSVDGEAAPGFPVRLRCNEPATFQRGDLLYGRVRKMGTSPRPFPGAFNYGFFLERDGLIETLQVISPSSNKRTPRQKLHITPTSSGSPLLHLYRSVDALRGAAIKRTLEYGGDHGGLLAAMLFGYRKDIDGKVLDAFRRVGIGHVLAISGLHVGLVVAMFWWLGGGIGWASRWRALFCLVLTVLYWGVTGGQVAATRATLMAAVYLAGVAWGKRGDMLNSLGTAAFIIVLLNPSAPVDVSFQLSFIAVVFIYMAMRRTPPPESERRTPDPRYNAVLRRKLTRWLTDLIRLSVATWAGLFPIIAIVFNQVNLAGLPINVAVIPWMSLVLAGGLLLPLLGWIPGLARLLTAPTWILSATASFVNSLYGSSFPVHAPSYFWTAVFYLCVTGLLFVPATPPGRFRWRWTRVAIAGIGISFAAMIIGMRSVPPPAGGRIAVLPGSGTGVVTVEAQNGSIALLGAIRRGGINEAGWLHYLRRKGPVAVVSVGDVAKDSLSVLSWHFTLGDVTALPGARKPEAKAATGWAEVPGAPGIEYAVRRDERGRLFWLTVRADGKTVTVVSRIRARQFAELATEDVPGANAELSSVYFSDSNPDFFEDAPLSGQVAVRGRMPAGGGGRFFRRNAYGVLLLENGLLAFDGTRWRPPSGTTTKEEDHSGE